jgi:AbiEi antitoxin C-terminal domain
VSIVRFEWAAKSLKTLAPSSKFLIDRKLDLLRWASALPGFGPEALVAQLAIRPSSFAPWADLVAHLGRLVDDCNDDRLVSLLNGQPTAAWQRAAYLLHGGGARERGISLLDRCSNKATPKTRFAHSAIDNADPVWVAQYNLIDALVAPLQAAIGKA